MTKFDSWCLPFDFVKHVYVQNKPENTKMMLGILY